MLLRQIKYFQEIINCGSFTKAAEECNISQSAISQQIALLEADLGIKLMTRHNRKFSLTPAGEYFYRSSLSLSREIEDLCRETVRIGRGGRAQLTIGYPKSLNPRQFLQGAIAEFVKMRPEISVQTWSNSHEGLYEMLRLGSANIVINDQRRVFSDEYVNLILVHCDTCIEVPADSHLASFEAVDIREVANEPCIIIAPSEQQENEAAYYRDVLGFNGEFIFAETFEEAELLVISGKGVLPIDVPVNLDVQKKAFTVTIKLCRSGKSIGKNLCAFWKTSRAEEYVKEFAFILRGEFDVVLSDA